MSISAGIERAVLSFLIILILIGLFLDKISEARLFKPITDDDTSSSFLSGRKRYAMVFIVSHSLLAIVNYFGLWIFEYNPSICSNKCGFIGFHIGSKIKSIPSLLANFAAGTKSLSPDTSIICSTCFFNVIEAISNPILMSTLFWSKRKGYILFFQIIN